MAPNVYISVTKKHPMKTRILPFLLVTACPAIAQQNALDFDNNGDQVIVDNASSLIAGEAAISLSCWVYPKNTAPNFPDFDGIAGFRNELDCDFYLLHLAPNTIEARMRNSAGIEFTVTGGPFTLNTWQLLVLTYDGSVLKLYANGTLSGSIAASGTLESTITPLLIGDLVYDLNQFWMNGRVDEIGLWKRALTEAEIACLRNAPPASNDPDLMLYFNCDQGTAGGSNSGITELIDATGHINGGISGFTMNGATSNFVQGATFGTATAASICPGGTYVFNGQTLSAPGVYQATFPDPNGCDSVVTLTLSQIPVNVNVLQSGATLTSLNGTASWQWLDCGNNFQPIPGATFQSFTPTQNGSYAVRVTANACTDTSACFNVTSIGINEVSDGVNVRLLRNIVQDELVLLAARAEGVLNLRVVDLLGSVKLDQRVTVAREMRIPVQNLASGRYLLQLISERGSRTVSFIKE